ncbi:MAG: hypothetical protein JO328_10895 [Hyphomicrobiales bacterium]|nr:hypothetical protein [Hyphomicrobiales bacterium]MBV8827155.1 hypothetical protein [Hyphomicrobiales bacterium]MBV9427947.1 hypothetical protein [Bradyrhizobiaceae bacterium]
MKEAAKEFFEFLRNFTPIWVIAILVAVILAYRMPSIIQAIATAFRESRRVSAEIERKKHKADRELADKLAKAQRRKGKQPSSGAKK